jgi:hypothetical protein
MDPITLALATPIAKIVLDKFYEGCGSKLGEKAIALATTSIEKLGNLVWEKCLKGKPGTMALLEAAAKGSEPESKQMKDYLLKALENKDLVKEVEPIVQEIHKTIVQMDDVQAENVLQAAGDGFQNIKTEGPILQGIKDSPINFITNHNYGTNSD